MPLPGLPEGTVPPADEELWRLTKGRRTAVLWQRLHPLGLELVVTVAGDVRRTEVARTPDAAQAVADEWRQAFEAKG